MGNISVLVGAGIVTFLLLILLWKLDGGKREDGGNGNTHVLLQILLLGFILAGIVVIGKASLDDSGKVCDWLVNSTNLNTVTNVTSYTYDYSCVSTSEGTGQTFYKLTVWIMRLIGIYILCYLVYVVLVYFGYIGQKKGRDDLQ